MKLLPLPVNDVSDGRSIPFPSSINSTLHYHRIVVVVGILINCFPIIITSDCFITQFDWLKLRKTYSSYYTLNNTNQGEGVCSIETLNTKLNGLKRYEIGHFKWLGILECIVIQLDWLKLRKTYFSLHSFIHTNQGEWWRRIETILTNVNRLKRSEIRHFKWFGILECVVIQFDWLKLRKTYSSYYPLNHTNQGEWWRSIETILTNVNRLKWSEIRHFKWLGILECIVTQSNRLKLGKSFASVHLLSPTNQSEWVGGIETILTNLNRFKRFQLCQFKRLSWLECLTADIERFQWLHIYPVIPTTLGYVLS